MTKQKYETYEEVIENLNLKLNGCDIPECPRCGNELANEDHQILICVRTFQYGCGWRKRYCGTNEDREIQRQNRERDSIVI